MNKGIRIFKDQAAKILALFTNRTTDDLKNIGPVRVGKSFMVVARFTGCCINYYLVPIIKEVFSFNPSPIIINYSPKPVVDKVISWMNKGLTFIKESFNLLHKKVKNEFSFAEKMKCN